MGLGRMTRDRVDVRLYDENRRDIWDDCTAEERVNFHPELLPLRLFFLMFIKNYNLIQTLLLLRQVPTVPALESVS
jgi:hypothetical protein